MFKSWLRMVLLGLVATGGALAVVQDAHAVHRKGQPARKQLKRIRPQTYTPYLTIIGITNAESAPSGGVLIDAVRSGSAADNAGLEPGDVINTVDGTPVNDIWTLAGLLQQDAGGTASLGVTDVRTGQGITLPISCPLLNQAMLNQAKRNAVKGTIIVKPPKK
jgi:S1-C subfamily serine protease